MGDTRAELSVLIRPADGTWQRLGTETGLGVFPEGLTLTANDSGPDTCSFTLRREAAHLWPDLLAFNQCEVWVGGVPVWGGRIWEAPISDTADDAIAVQGRGWQYHLDDDLVQGFYAHTRMTDYVDQRSKATSTLSAHKATPRVVTGEGVIELVFPSGYTVTTNEQVVATFDAGDELFIRAVVVWERIGVNDPDDSIRLRGSVFEDAAQVGDDQTAALTSASGTLTRTFSVPVRYHHVMVYRNGAGATFGADQGVRITAIRLFSAAAYESGDASILKASDVARSVLSAGAMPLLNSSPALVEDTSFSIPELVIPGYSTPRAVINAANAYEANRFGVDAQRNLFFKEREIAPTLEVGSWSGVDFQDASTNSGEGLYNRVIVQATGPDGAPINEIRTATSGLLNRQGFTRTATLNVRSALTTTAAQQIGDLWLSERSSPPFKGSVVIRGQGGCRRLGGGAIHPSELLLHVGQRLRVNHLIDPNTGGWGRDGLIRSVSYAHDTETATVELDNERGRFEALLERLAVVVEQIR